MSAEVDPATGELDPVNRWADEIDQPSKPVVLMTEAEALKITAEIKSWAGTLWKKLKEAHDGQAWRALGYTSWRAYLDGEFDISKSQGYRLIAHARAVEELDAAAGFTGGEVSPAGDTLTERDTRDLDVEVVAAAVRAAFDTVPKGTTASSADLAAAIIASIVGQHRAPQEPGTTKTTTTTVTTSPDAASSADGDRTGEGGSAPVDPGATSPGQTTEPPAGDADGSAEQANATADSDADDLDPSLSAEGSGSPHVVAVPDAPDGAAAGDLMESWPVPGQWGNVAGIDDTFARFMDRRMVRDTETPKDLAGRCPAALRPGAASAARLAARSLTELADLLDRPTSLAAVES